MSVAQNLTTGEFEDAMERSFIQFLQREIPTVTASGEVTDVLVMACAPNDFFLEQRESKAVIDISFNQITTEGFCLGGVVFDDTATEGASSTFHTYAPYEYMIDATINVYTSSGQQRAKIDGNMRDILGGLIRGYKECPVFEYRSDTEAATSVDTGCRIRVDKVSDLRSLHAENLNESDYLSNWTVLLRCLFYKQSDANAVLTITRSVTANY